MQDSRAKRIKSVIISTIINMNYISKVAKLLGTSETTILNLEAKMNQITQKTGIIDNIVRENEREVAKNLKELFPERDIKYGNHYLDKITAPEVYEALIKKVKEDNKKIFDYFGKPDFSTKEDCEKLLESAREASGNPSGFFIKKEKAEELLRTHPPQNIMKALNYSDIDKLLEKEDVFEIFCALRFVEEESWLNNTFFKAYENLKKEDFEQRKIKIVVLPERWTGIGEKFLQDKLHHMSHLKEMGIVFVIPVPHTPPGNTLYLFFMMLHYIYEVKWFSKLFEKCSKEKDFSAKVINALKVESSKEELPNEKKMSWRITPKYFAKENPEDPRLKEPRLNSEAWHYKEVISALERFSSAHPETGIGFWTGLETVAEKFKINSSEEAIISFNLFDNNISLLKEAKFNSRFNYHYPEALWNRIFSEYMGEEKLEKALMENLKTGYTVL